MAESKHTPGPWWPQTKVARYAGVNGARILGAGDEHVASVSRAADKPIDRKQADLALIAAAPDLLEAAKLAFVGEVGRSLALKVERARWQWPDDAPAHVSGLAEALRAAIAKAEPQ